MAELTLITIINNIVSTRRGGYEMIETICQGLKEDSLLFRSPSCASGSIFPVAHGVLQVHQDRVVGRSEVCRAHEGHDRRISILWPSDDGSSVGGATRTQCSASSISRVGWCEETCHRVQALHRGVVLCGNGPE